MHIEASPRPVGDGEYEFCVGGAWRGWGVDVVRAVSVGVHFPGVGVSEGWGRHGGGREKGEKGERGRMAMELGMRRGVGRGEGVRSGGGERAERKGGFTWRWGEGFRSRLGGRGRCSGTLWKFFVGGC